jgi:hypothetical protein
MQLSTNDLEQLEQLGITPELLEQQLSNYTNGFPFIRLSAHATVGNGIITIDSRTKGILIEQYKKYDGKRVKFIPASGAATRMFKNLFECLEEIKQKGKALFDDRSSNSSYIFFEKIHSFAFSKVLNAWLTAKGANLETLLKEKQFKIVLETLLNSEFMDYGNLPKGLLLFHSYGDSSRTALEEHLVEGALYACEPNGNVRIHLTVSSEHLDSFKLLLEKVAMVYQKKFAVTFLVSFSLQKRSTDTIAVDVSNHPLRDSNGKLLFRPGGHGALLQNLNDQLEPLIFIKNIDNVVPDYLKAETVEYKMVIAGLLLTVKELMHSTLQKAVCNDLSESEFLRVKQIMLQQYFIKVPEPDAYETTQQWTTALVDYLNKPIRVCGMVRNEGEPGGGPFWVEDRRGELSLQIVESSQINMNDSTQKEMFNKSTHFNPVDLVCWTYDYKNHKFDLDKYSDSSTGFIAQKSKDGKILKAQELPGLWNGAMAKWITLFVEVPLITFNPVKTVNDLLRKEHQSLSNP